MSTTAKNTKNTTATKTTKNVSKKEETKMSKNTKNVKPAETKATEKPALSVAETKENVRAIVDGWISEFKTEAEANGMKVEVKTWEKIPTCRSLKVDGVTYFEIYYSARGARLNAKSKLIPEALRPAGSNIIQNGLDLTIPTIAPADLAKDLTKYADACRKSLASAKAAKEAERKAKEDAAKAKQAEKAKAEKAKAKAAETKNAAK